jgi:ribosomal protein S18 acetylase RimI-like enzyme
MEQVTVRQATPEDAAALAVLLDQFDGAGATPAQVAARMQACGAVLTTCIAEVEGQMAGFACLQLVPQLQGDAPHAELTDLYVDPPFRRRGVARALMTKVEMIALAAGADDIVVITGFDNDGAQDAYHAQGYARWAQAMRKCFSGVTEDGRCIER